MAGDGSERGGGVCAGQVTTNYGIWCKRSAVSGVGAAHGAIIRIANQKANGSWSGAALLAPMILTSSADAAP